MLTTTLPSETLCIVFCDIANSTTDLAQSNSSDEGVRVAQQSAYLEVWKAFFQSHGALTCNHRGDGWLAAFPDVWQAVNALAAAWEQAPAVETADYRMRACVHWGSVWLKRDEERQTLEPLGINATLVFRGQGAAFCDQMLITEPCVQQLEPILPSDWELFPAGRHLAKGLPEPIALYSLRAPGMPVAPRRAKGSLPAPINEFVGRRREMRELSEITLNSGKRCVTLLGAGGSGKSRLAMELGRRMEPDFADGVFFIPLEEAQTMDNVLTRIANALEIRLTPEINLLMVLQAELQKRERLLILDNFEQVQEPALPLLTLCETCPELRLLVTSREPLYLRGECTIDLDTLPLPPANADKDTILQADSVQLFLQRVQGSRRLEPTPENAASIAALCRTLDGLPLAIELVAAQVRRHSLAELLLLRHELLDIGSQLHGLPSRQRSLRAAFDWTYDRLDDAERYHFSILSIFETPFGIRDAEAVGDFPNGCDILEHLRDKSLVALYSEEPERTYRLLMPVREYARKRYGEPDRGTRRRFTAWYRDKAEQIYKLAFEQNNERDALRHIRANLENFRMAWQMAEEDGDTYSVGILGMAVTSFAPQLPSSAKIEGWIPAAEAALLTLDNTLALHRLVNTMARLARIRGDFTKAVAHQRRVLQYFTETALFHKLADAQSTLAHFEFLAEMRDDAERSAHSALITADAILSPMPTGLAAYAPDVLTTTLKAKALALCILANLHLPASPEHAENLAQQGLALFEQADDPVGKMHAWLALGESASARSHLSLAEDRYQAALNESLLMDSPLYQARCAEFIARFYQAHGLPDIATDLLFSVLEVQKMQGMTLSAANALQGAEPLGIVVPLSDAVRSLLSSPRKFTAREH